MVLVVVRVSHVVPPYKRVPWPMTLMLWLNDLRSRMICRARGLLNALELIFLVMDSLIGVVL